MRALVIDDDCTYRALLRTILENLGWTVEEAWDGQVGCQMFQLQPFDLVVCDLIMPTQEGLETIRLIRRHDPSIWIIAISGGTTLPADEYLRMALAFGADRALAKPFGNAEIEAALGSRPATGTPATGPAAEPPRTTSALARLALSGDLSNVWG